MLGEGLSVCLLAEQSLGTGPPQVFLPRTAQRTRLLPRMEPTMMKLKATVHIVLDISPSASARVVSFTGERSALNLLLRKEIKFNSDSHSYDFCRWSKNIVEKKYENFSH